MVKAGLNVTFFDPWWKHVEAVKANGLTVNVESGSQTIDLDIKHVSEVSETKEPFDLVFTAVKAYDTRWVAELIRPLLTEKSAFVGLQNGMTIDESAEILGTSRTVGAVLGIAANLPEPGVVNRECDSSQTWIAVGELSGEETERLHTLKQILGTAAQVEITDDIRSAKWMKLLANIPEMLPSGILGLPLLEAANAAGIRDVMDQMSREAYRLASDLGITFLPTLGLSAKDVAPGEQYAIDLLDVILRSYSRPGTRVAVLQDWDKGRRAEIDAFSGYIVQERARIQGKAPVNAAVVKIARAIEAGTLQPSPKNRELLLETLSDDNDEKRNGADR
jgi:2-dehydropantoate 2-reductase